MPVTPAAHFQSIDGLRGLACLAVVVHHCYLFAGECPWPLGLPALLSRGYLGVEVFFVLSGFCLAYPILRHPERPTDWRQFAYKRAWRILPAYWAAVLLLAFLGMVFRAFQIQPFAATDMFAALNIRQWIYTLFLIGINYNVSFWTLNLEARWYFLFPVAMSLYRRFNIRLLIALSCVISIAYVVMQHKFHSEKMQFLTGHFIPYAPLFALGIACAHLFVNQKYRAWRWVTPLACRFGVLFSLALIGVFLQAHPPPYDGRPLIYMRLIPGGLLAVSLILGALCDPVIQRVLAWKPLAGVGLCSYSLYLLHLPLIQMMYCVTKPLHWTPMAQFFFYYGLMVMFCIGIAYVFYRAVELPFLSRKLQSKKQPIRNSIGI